MISETRSLVGELGSHLGVETLERDDDGVGTLAAEGAILVVSCQEGFSGVTPCPGWHTSRT